VPPSLAVTSHRHAESNATRLARWRFDAIIAATALVSGLPLVHENARDFEAVRHVIARHLERLPGLGHLTSSEAPPYNRKVAAQAVVTTAASRYGIRTADVRGILSETSGFIRDAGFTHSLTPARNCTYGCTYCYVPTMGLYGGLKPEDWQRWGQFTTFKQNAPELLVKALRPGQVIYCSPLVDPYQPAEADDPHMPAILLALIANPPARFVLQTRSPLCVRDVALLAELKAVVSFSLTTDDDAIRRLYEPHCEPLSERLAAIALLREKGLRVHATLAPLLPCDPEKLAQIACEATEGDLVGDPLHVRATKKQGATTREAAFRIASKLTQADWFDPAFQAQAVRRIASVAEAYGRQFLTGPAGFRTLTV
jgi:DNA repair photolyase